ncbi:MAG: alpha/beta hydrolase [Thermomicrobiales bacterium]
MARRWGFAALALLMAAMSSPFMVFAQSATPETGSAAKGVVSDVTGIDLTGIVATASNCSFISVAGQPLVTEDLGEVACGTVAVPENWTNPGARTLKISYVVLKSFSETPEADPVVYLEGGPGGSALAGVSMMAEIFQVQRETRDIVLFDQRGTQFSSPLICSALTIDDAVSSFASPEVAIEEPEETPEVVGPVDLSPSTDVEGMMADARAQVGDKTARCVAELLGKGIDLRQYNSIANANDTVALVNALGYETYNLYGISYGTRLALVLMRDHPEGIRSVVLDSTFPPEIHGFELYPKEAEEVVLQVFADCRIDPSCNAAYPNLKERFSALIDAMQEQPLEIADGRIVTALDVIEVMRNIAFATDTAAYIPRMIAELEQGETETYDVIVGGLLFQQEGIPVDAEDGDMVATPEVVEAETAATPTDDVSQVTADADEAAAAPPIDLIPDAGADGQPLTPAELFIDDVQVRLGHLDPERQDMAISLLITLDKMPHTADTLTGFVNAVFAGPDYARDRAALLEEIASLSSSDLEGVFAITSQQIDFIDIVTFGSSDTAFNSVECNEEIPFESFAKTVQNAQNLEIPELAYGISEGIARQFAICEQWPSGRAPDFENDPVVSDIPTLILGGEYDFQTPLSWNKEAFVNLANAYFVQFPSTGHGVILPTDCAKNVAQQFIDVPFLAPVASCADDLWPAWSLPGDPLPQPYWVEESTPVASPAS